MDDSQLLKSRFSIKIINERDKSYRQYIFLNDSDEIVNKIYRHTFYFLTFSEFSSNTKLFSQLTFLCHKVNMVKYHLRRYEELETKLRKKFEADTRGKIKEGTFLIEECELTAEYESFLLQTKATLDVLVGFLNPIYRKDNKNPLKKQVTFENKGLNLIKDLENYLRKHPDKKQHLCKLVDHLKAECTNSTHFEDGSINWLFTLIDIRDTVAHLGKSESFAFQITNIKANKSVLPPRLSPEQSMLDAFKVAYENLLIFVQDFIALTLGPYLNQHLESFTFREEEVKEDAPKWYIMLRAFRQFGLKSLRTNPLVVEQFCRYAKLPIDPIKCMRMHMYYNNFYK
jgi:hypothetical protein